MVVKRESISIIASYTNACACVCAVFVVCGVCVTVCGSLYVNGSVSTHTHARTTAQTHQDVSQVERAQPTRAREMPPPSTPTFPTPPLPPSSNCQHSPDQ